MVISITKNKEINMNKKKIKPILTLALLSLLIIFGIFLYNKQSNIVSTDNAYTKADIVPLAAKVSGYIKKVFIKDNQRVKKGDVLFTIVDEDYKLKLDLEQANIDTIKSEIDNLDEQISMQKSIIKQVEANFKSSLSTLKLANLNYDRTRNLLNRNATSKSDFDKKQNEKNQSDYNMIASKNKLETEQKRLKVLIVNKRTIEHQLDQAKAKFDLAKINLKDTLVLAPFDGVVANRQVQLGKYVSVGVSLLSLVDINNIWMVANFKETQISNLELNQEVEIKIDGFDDEIFTGRIDSLSPASGASLSMLSPDNATGNFVRVVQRVPVKILFNYSKRLHKLVAGLSSEVNININQN